MCWQHGRPAMHACCPIPCCTLACADCRKFGLLQAFNMRAETEMSTPAVSNTTIKSRHRTAVPKSFQEVAQLSHDENLVFKWSTQKHVKIKEGGRSYLWLGLSLANLHLPGI